MFKSIICAFALLSVAVASPVELRKRQSSTTCGSNSYSSSDLQAAVAQGVDHLNNPIGSNNYPHTFNNREGFDFQCSGSKFNEFPILASGELYEGGSPSTDRVVFTDDGEYCGAITHTGASGNNFVACE